MFREGRTMTAITDSFTTSNNHDKQHQYTQRAKSLHPQHPEINFILPPEITKNI